MTEAEFGKATCFRYQVNGDRSRIMRVPLHREDVGTLLEQLKFGGNLFNVLPELDSNVFDHSLLEQASFEQGKTAIVDGETFLSPEGYKRVGKLLLPHYRMSTRRDIRLKANRNKNHSAKRVYNKVLSESPEAEMFYCETPGRIIPYSASEMLILSADQLQ